MILLGLQHALDVDESEAVDLSSIGHTIRSQTSPFMSDKCADEHDDDDENNYLIRI